MAATTTRQAAIISSTHWQHTFISRAPQLATGMLESKVESHLAVTRKALACGLKPCTTLQSLSAPGDWIQRQHVHKNSSQKSRSSKTICGSLAAGCLLMHVHRNTCTGSTSKIQHTHGLSQNRESHSEVASSIDTAVNTSCAFRTPHIHRLSTSRQDTCLQKDRCLIHIADMKSATTCIMRLQFRVLGNSGQQNSLDSIVLGCNSVPHNALSHALRLGQPSKK